MKSLLNCKTLAKGSLLGQIFLLNGERISREVSKTLQIISFNSKSIFQENETHAILNRSLKSEIQVLERERKRLKDALDAHEASCLKSRRRTTTQSNDIDDILAELLQPQLEPKRETADLQNLSATIKVENWTSPVDNNLFMRPVGQMDHLSDKFQPQARLYDQLQHYVPGGHYFADTSALGGNYLDFDNRCIALGMS